MLYYVVTDSMQKEHLVEAASPGTAIAQIPNGEMVRVATSREVYSVKKKEIENSKG